MCVRISFLVAFCLVCAGCGGSPPGEGPGAADEAAAVGRVLDDWHAAASEADGARYFGHFSDRGVFLGTDAGERWTVEAFRAYAEPYFSKGRGWTYEPADRQVMFDGAGGLAWFDEKLRSEKYGELRGTGVLEKVGTEWKIAHYNMTFTIPNDLSSSVVALIRGDAEGVP